MKLSNLTPIKLSLQPVKLLLLCLMLLFRPVVCHALSPDEVVVIANRNAASSVGLAEYYMKKRQIPKKNLILLWVTDKETCTRKEYDQKIAPVVRRQLRERYKPYQIRCLVTVYGVPLKIAGTKPSRADRALMNRLLAEKSALTRELESKKYSDDTKRKALRRRLNRVDDKILQRRFKQNTGASLDSELSLVLAPAYDIGGWIPNPYFIGFRQSQLKIKKKDVLMVSRLDGPTPKIVRRIIDDSLAVEKKGLTGTAYIDARWPDPGNKPVSGYAFYDKSLHEAAKIIEESGRMPVRIDDTPKLFSPGECKHAALYCGWYSLAHYINAFQWQPGSVGYHIASEECETLHNPKSQVWCIRMLEEGVAATIGPVSEPYVQSFPIPAIFFKYLTDGNLGLAECYILSTPYLSWKQVLVGDPMYRPFKNSPSPGN